MDYHFPLPKSLHGLYTQKQTHKYNFDDATSDSQYQQTSKEAFSDKEIFYLSNKPIADSEWDSIIRYIMNSPFVKSLHFSGISLNKFGLQSIGTILLSNKEIKSLKIEWNFFNNLVEEFESFCDLISKSQLEYLELNNNKLSSLHINGLLRLLKSKSLLSINLKWNEIGNDSARAFIDHLRTNSSIQEIQFAGNKISSEVMSELDECIMKNKKNKYNSIMYSTNKSLNNFYHPDYAVNSTGEFKQRNKEVQYYLTPVYEYEQSGGNQISYSQSQSQQRQNSPKKNDLVEEEYKARYDKQLFDNINLDKKITELELELKAYKTKYIEVKDKSEQALQVEVDKYNILEQQYLELKDAFIKKDYELTQTINDFEGKVSDIINENERLIIENNSLQEKISLTENICEERVKIEKTSNRELIETLSRSISELKVENEKTKQESFNEIKIILDENNKKLKLSEDLAKKLEKEKDSLQKELTLLKKELNEVHITKDMEFKSRESMILDEENKKFEAVIKEFEMKFLTLNNIMKDLSSKNGMISEENLKIKREFNDEIIKLESTVNNLRNEKENLSNELSQISRSNTFMKSQIEVKEELIKKYKTELNEANEKINKLSLSINGKFDELVALFNNEKNTFEQKIHDLGIDNSNLLSKTQILKEKNEILEQEKIQLKEVIIKNIEQYIDDEYKNKYLTK